MFGDQTQDNANMLKLSVRSGRPSWDDTEKLMGYSTHPEVGCLQFFLFVTPFSVPPVTCWSESHVGRGIGNRASDTFSENLNIQGFPGLRVVKDRAHG